MTVVRGLSVMSLAALVVAGTEGAASAATPDPAVSSSGTVVRAVAAKPALDRTPTADLTLGDCRD